MDLTNVPEHAKAGLIAMNKDQPFVQPGAIDSVVAQYREGKSIRKIAEEMGCAHQTVYEALWREIPDKWPDIRAARAERQYDDAIEKMADETVEMDGLDIGRARETARFRFGELAALRRAFSPKNENNQGFKVLIVREQDVQEAQVIEVEPAKLTQR